MQIKNDVVPSGAASFCYERLVVVNGLSCKCTHIDVIKSCESNSIRSFYFAFMFSFCPITLVFLCLTTEVCVIKAFHYS